MNANNSPAARLLSIDELDRDIVNLTDRLNAGTFELLVLALSLGDSCQA